MASRSRVISFVKATATSSSSSSSSPRLLSFAARTCRQCRQPPHRRLVTTTRTAAATKAAIRPAAAAAFFPPRPRTTQQRAVPFTGVRAYSQGAESKIWDFEDIQKLTKDPKPNVIIIDAREPNELQETGRIPGAVNIPIKSAPDSFHIQDEEFEDRYGYPRPGKDVEVVMYCRSGVRSQAAAQMARDAGWTKVGEYPGSWLDWAGKGGKVER